MYDIVMGIIVFSLIAIFIGVVIVGIIEIVHYGIDVVRDIKHPKREIFRHRLLRLLTGTTSSNLKR